MQIVPPNGQMAVIKPLSILPFVIEKDREIWPIEDVEIALSKASKIQPVPRIRTSFWCHRLHGITSNLFKQFVSTNDENAFGSIFGGFLAFYVYERFKGLFLFIMFQFHFRSRKYFKIETSKSAGQIIEGSLKWVKNLI